MRRSVLGWEPHDEDEILKIFKREEARIDDPEAMRAAMKHIFFEVMFGDSDSQ